jgi:hypothetical protein
LKSSSTICHCRTKHLRCRRCAANCERSFMVNRTVGRS